MAVAVVGLAVPAAVGANRYHRGRRLRCHHLPPKFTMNVVFWLIFAAACTSIPLAFDMARTFLPARYRFGRLVSAWHRPALLTLVLFLCGVGYYLFWATFLPYRRARASLGGALHATLATYLWINVVWNYAMCAAVVAGEPDEKKDPEGAPLLSGHYCKICRVRAPNFDHHCPFTGGCIGRDNFRFFALFCLWGWCGMAYACAMSWTPFSDCVLSQVTIYHIGWKAAPPPSEEACQALAARSFVFVPALVIFAALTSLFGLNALLVANNITLKRFNGLMNGPNGIFGFVLTLQCRTTPDIDKRMLIFGPTAGGAVGRARVLLLPSLPWSAKWRFHEGVEGYKYWLGALVAIAVLMGVIGGVTTAFMSIANMGPKTMAAGLQRMDFAGGMGGGVGRRPLAAYEAHLRDLGPR